ncbi:MAG: hypothetical protein ABEL97_04070 [Salinibacter sp.]
MTLAAIVVFTLTGAFFRTGLGGAPDLLLGMLAGVLGVAVFAGVTLAVIAAVEGLPTYVVAALGGAIGAICTAVNVGFSWPDEIFYASLLGYVWTQAILGGTAWVLLRGGLRTASTATRAAVVGGLVLTVAANGGAVLWLAGTGTAPTPVEVAPPPAGNIPVLDADNPAHPGSYAVRRLSYGSGTDLRRPAFGSEVDVRTEPVDGSRLLPAWSGFTADYRAWYWGFGIENWPINGRVWMPEGKGPFPLVIVVHGNHAMQEYSDPGYAYLGELLASRGFITVSVDENFINSSWDDGFDNSEIPARAWLLLRHLKQWRTWNRAEGTPFSGKVDLQHIGLVGHSRGGEAAAVAARFNTLPAFPDDAKEAFNFGFSIESVVALAPTDYRYARQPGIELENVSYLTLAGSYDIDERSLFGVRQFQRISFTDGYDGFKAALYFHRGNHGQFNTVWGSEDFGPPSSWFLNTGPLIDGADQRQIAKVYVSAFMEATLRGRDEYIPLFRTHHAGANWLPDVAMLHRFKSPAFRPVATFEEDLDVTTASLPGSRIETRRMAEWRERDLPFRGERTQQNNAAILEWTEAPADGRPVPPDSAARYRIVLPDEPPAWTQTEAGTLVFNLTRMKDDGYERPTAGTDTIRADGGMGLRVALVDEDSTVVGVPLREYGTVPPLLHTQYMKLERLSAPFGAPWEPTLQTYEIPLADVAARDSAFDTTALRQIVFSPDRRRRGAIALDNVGIRGTRP